MRSVINTIYKDFYFGKVGLELKSVVTTVVQLLSKQVYSSETTVIHSCIFACISLPCVLKIEIALQAN